MFDLVILLRDINNVLLIKSYKKENRKQKRRDTQWNITNYIRMILKLIIVN